MKENNNSYQKLSTVLLCSLLLPTQTWKHEMQYHSEVKFSWSDFFETHYSRDITHKSQKPRNCFNEIAYTQMAFCDWSYGFADDGTNSVCLWVVFTCGGHLEITSHSSKRKWIACVFTVIFYRSSAFLSVFRSFSPSFSLSLSHFLPPSRSLPPRSILSTSIPHCLLREGHAE